MSQNVCSFHGRLGNNPEITTLPSGKERVRFSIAVDRDYKDQDGNRPTDWIPVTIWGSANYVRKANLAKGDSVIVTGRMENYQWTDAEGKTKTAMGLNVDKIYLTGKKRENERANGQNANTQASDNFNSQSNEDDDLPF